MIAVLLLAAAAPVAAARSHQGYQEIEDFEGVVSSDYGDTSPDDGTLAGGTVVTSAFAHSGDHVYSGTELVFSVADPFNYSWPAVGAWVTGPAAVTLTLYQYYPDLAVEAQYASVSTAGPANDEYLSFGSDVSPQFLTRAVFSSTQTFTIDDFTLGLIDVGPGVPEPATWVMLIAGFGFAGTAMRRRARLA